MKREDNDDIVFEAASIMFNISTDCDPHIPYIISANGVEALIKLLDPMRWRICKKALNTLVNIVACNFETCHHVLSLGALKFVKELLNHGLDKIQSLALEFVFEVIENKDDDHLDSIIDSDLILSILKLINDVNTTDAIITYAFQVIQSFVDKRHGVISTLLEQNIVSIACNKLFKRTDPKLIIAVLSMLESIISIEEYEKKICDEFESCCNGQKSLQKHLKNKKKTKKKCIDAAEIERLSNRINTFLIEKKTVSQCEKIVKSETNDFCYEAESNGIVTVQSCNKRRAEDMQLNDQNTTAIKKPRASNESADNVQFNDSEDYEEKCRLFDNSAGPSSQLTLTLPDLTTPINDVNRQEQVNSTVNPPLIFELPKSFTSPTTHDLNLRNTNSFNTFEYLFPPESFLKKCCKQLGLNFNRKEYARLLEKIDFDEMSPESEPSSYLSTTGDSDFSIFSIFFTGTEENTVTIRQQINKKFVDDIKPFDEDKICEVFGRPHLLKPEHFLTIASWFNCRILVYCNNNGWEKYGNWNLEEDSVPTFVLTKTSVSSLCHIVLSLR